MSYNSGEMVFVISNHSPDYSLDCCHSAEHDIILESYAKISSGLETPDTNYVEQCNTMPNNSTIANMNMYIIRI